MKANYTSDVLQQMQLFSNGQEAQVIMKQFGDDSLFEQMLAMLQQVEYIIRTIPKLVPSLPITKEQKTKEKYKHVKQRIETYSNIVHVPFRQLQQPSPLFIVINEADSQMLQLIKVHLMPLIELCAREQRDVYIISNETTPIALKEGIFTAHTFQKLMKLTPARSLHWELTQLVSHSIALPLKHEFQLMLVQFSGEKNPLDAQQCELVTSWKQIFNCSIKGMFGDESQLPIDATLLEEVYIVDSLKK